MTTKTYETTIDDKKVWITEVRIDATSVSSREATPDEIKAAKAAPPESPDQSHQTIVNDDGTVTRYELKRVDPQTVVGVAVEPEPVAPAAKKAAKE